MSAPLSSESDKLDEARFRARMARVSESGAMPSRRRPSEEDEEDRAIVAADLASLPF